VRLVLLELRSLVLWKPNAEMLRESDLAFTGHRFVNRTQKQTAGHVLLQCSGRSPVAKKQMAKRANPVNLRAVVILETEQSVTGCYAAVHAGQALGQRSMSSGA
jgi:hypothetical protein